MTINIRIVSLFLTLVVMIGHNFTCTMEPQRPPGGGFGRMQTDNIWWAAGKGNIDALKYWLNPKVTYRDAAKKIANAKDKNGQTPLGWAAGKGQKAAVLYLLEHGADANSEDNNNMTPLEWARRGNYIEVANILLPYTSKIYAQEKNKIIKDAIWVGMVYNQSNDPVRLIYDERLALDVFPQRNRDAQFNVPVLLSVGQSIQIGRSTQDDTETYTISIDPRLQELIVVNDKNPKQILDRLPWGVTPSFDIVIGADSIRLVPSEGEPIE